MALFTSRRRILAEKRSVWGKEEKNLRKKEKCLREISVAFRENKRRFWRKQEMRLGKSEKSLSKISDAFAKNKNRKCLQPTHVHYSFCTRSAPHFYEHTTSAERVMNVGTTSDERGEHKEKRWCETGRDEELKREGEVYM